MRTAKGPAGAPCGHRPRTPQGVTGIRAGWRWRRFARAGIATQAVTVATLLVTVLLGLVVIRLPWIGDLGIHAATIERLRHDLGNPGDPLVDADVPSPYYSPWMVLLAVIGKVGGFSTFGVLHLAALVDLVLLISGIRHVVRTLTARRAAVPLAILCVTLLMGWEVFDWSGFQGLTSLAVCLGYPSTFALGACLHLWAWMRTALARGWELRRFLGLGVLLALVMLVHQFTGMVAAFGLLAVMLGQRPWPQRAVWLRAAVGAALAGVILAAWPYYSFFSLLRAGGDLDAIHRSLYENLTSRFGLVILGVAALGVRFRRDRRDPLVLLFCFGSVVYGLGGITGHYAMGRVLPAALIAAQLALAIEAAGAGGRQLRRIFAPLTASALLIGAWNQAVTLSLVLPTHSVPVLDKLPVKATWNSEAWITPHVPYGSVVMTKDYYPLRQVPAYGACTVESAYPDVFLRDQQQRTGDTNRYFAPGTSRAERLRILNAYHVGWILQTAGDGGLPVTDPAVRRVATGPDGEILLHVVG